MKIFDVKTLLFLLSFAVIFTSCSDDDDEPEEENVEETITTMNLTFTPSSGGSPVFVTAVDADGDGPANIVIGDIALAANTEYSLTVQFLNTLETPVEDVTEEILEEDDEHQVFFIATGDVFTGEGIYEDMDDNGLPVGLNTTWTTSAGGSGTFRVVLKHQPGVKTATSGLNDGGTDIDVTYPITVQ